VTVPLNHAVFYAVNGLLRFILPRSNMPARKGDLHMPAKQSQEVRNAMQFVVDGHSIYDAAHKAGVWPSTLYRAIGAVPKLKKLAATNKSRKRKIK
jgi:hypothetical protein